MSELMEYLKHYAHIFAVEVGLHTPSVAEKIIKSRPLKTYPGNPFVLKPQPFRWGATRFLGRRGKVLGFSVKRVPVIGPLIDIFTPSNTIASDAEEKRMLREARKKNQLAPSVEQGKQYGDGMIFWPKSREWCFPPTTITLSKPAKPQYG